jgi:hypothetical protein
MTMNAATISSEINSFKENTSRYHKLSKIVSISSRLLQERRTKNLSAIALDDVVARISEFVEIRDYTGFETYAKSLVGETVQ